METLVPLFFFHYRYRGQTNKNHITMKKIIKTLVVVVLLSTILASCGAPRRAHYKRCAGTSGWINVANR